MKRLIVYITLLAVLLNARGDIAPIEGAIIGALIPLAIGEKYYVGGISKTGTLNIRSGASSKYRKIGELAYNASELNFEKCIYNKKYEKWCQLGSPFLEINGWVSGKYTDYTNPYIIEEQYRGVKFEVTQHQEDNFLNVKSGKGTKFATIDKLDYKRNDIIVSTCQENKKNEKWCWVNYGKEKFGWISKKSITPNINSCNTAIRFSNDKEIMKELCQRDGEKFEKQGKYDNAISSYMFAEKTDKIIKIYKSKKLIKSTDSYKMIAYAYKKNGDNKISEKILTNHNKWNHDIGWGDYEGEKRTNLYLKWYPQEKEIIFPKSEYSDEGGDIAPVIPIMDVDEKQALITSCVEIVEKENLTIDNLYQGCSKALEELRFEDISELKDKHKLLTIIMILDEVAQEKMMFNRYYSNMKSSLLSSLYSLEYGYLRNDIFKEKRFKYIFYNMVDGGFSYYDKIDKKIFLEQFRLLKSLGERLPSASVGVKTFVNKLMEIQNRYQEMSDVGVCLLSAYKKKDKMLFVKNLNPIYYDKNTHTLKVSNLIEYYIMPLIVQYIPKDPFELYFNNIKDNKEDFSPKEKIEDIEERFQNPDNEKEAFFYSLFNTKDIENSLLKYMEILKDKNATSIYNRYINTKIQPLLLKSDSMRIKNNEMTIDIVSNSVIKFMILGCNTKSENKNTQKRCLEDITEHIKTIKDIYTLDNEILATLYFAKEDYIKAIYYIKELFEEKEYDAKSIKLAQHYEQLAVSYYKLKKFNKSFKYLKKSLSIFESYSNSIKYCNTLKLLLLLDKDMDIDKSYLKEQKTKMTKCKIYNILTQEDYMKLEGQILTATFMNISNSPCLDINSIVKDAMPELDTDGIEASIKMNGKYSLITSKLYRQKAELLFSDKKYKQAYQSIQESFEIILYIRDVKFPYMTYLQKVDFLDEIKQYISLYLDISYHTIKDEDDNIQQTLNNWLNYKGSIFDSENAITTLYENTKDIELKEKIDDLHIKQRAYAKLQQSFSNKKDYKQKLKEKEEEINSLTNDISSHAKRFKEAQGLKNIKYQDISSTLKEDEIYIDYAKAGENYYIFTLDKKENITFTQIDKNNTKEIDKLVEAFRVDIAEILQGLGKLTPNRLKQLNQSSQKTLSHLYTLLIEPLSISIKGKDKLLISPDGALRLLPFEALYDNHHYLIEDKEILYTPSGKERVRVTRYNQIENNETKNSKVVIFADPDYLYIPNEKLIAWEKEDANQIKQGEIVYTEAFEALSTLPESFNRLETTNKEAKAVADAFDIVDIDEYKRKRANERNLFQTKHPKILHLSTHGFFLNAPNVTNPMLKSGIILTGATKARRFNRDEGIVTALKLSGLQLKNTDLVVLSACQTAEVDSNSTQSVSGLSKAFIQAGAKNVLSTLWSVAELETTTLISDFYNQIAKKRGYSTALREAKLEMITQGKHPFFWGGFVLFGE